jgi:hypothetical protein
VDLFLSVAASLTSRTKRFSMKEDLKDLMKLSSGRAGGSAEMEAFNK